jgi:hypothetical protein
MVLILLNAGDKSALWLDQQLLLNGIKSFAVTPDEILTNKSFVLSLVDGQYMSRLELRNGLVIENDRVDAIINRITYLPSLFQKIFTPSDADYVSQEWHSIYLSWLHGLRKKILFNKASATGLSGEQYNLPEWMMLASKAGFYSFPYKRDHTTAGNFEIQNDPSARCVSLTCFEQQCLAHEYFSERIPGSIKEAALQLQQLSGIEMIGIQMLLTKDGWWFKEATPSPDLIATGSRIIPLIAQKILMHPEPI